MILFIAVFVSVAIMFGYALYLYYKPYPEVPDETIAASPNNQERTENIHQILSKYNKYYTQLSQRGRLKFISRVLYLLRIKKVVGFDGFHVHAGVKILILAAQVQLTFGYSRFSLPKFKKFIVYPEQFYSKYIDRHVKGLTVGAGFIALSWSDAVHGYAHADDNLNLALHELAHALEIQVKHFGREEKELRKIFSEHGNAIRDKFKEMSALKPHSEDYLREYGLTNEHEFFAVCVEHFFETPSEFKQRLGDLYKKLVKLLNQDPTNTTNDYKVHEIAI